ncbi:hypothetical protein Tco_1542459, partial [Tanacetum coccineum]
ALELGADGCCLDFSLLAVSVVDVCWGLIGFLDPSPTSACCYAAFPFYYNDTLCIISFIVTQLSSPQSILQRLVKLLVLTYRSVAMYGICVICVLCVFVGYVRLDNQSIERDRLNGIGFVLDFVEFISFTFDDKEMISVIEAVSR